MLCKLPQCVCTECFCVRAQSTVNGKARPRNAEWTKVGLLEAEPKPKPKPKPQTVKLDESSGELFKATYLSAVADTGF